MRPCVRAVDGEPSAEVGHHTAPARTRKEAASVCATSNAARLEPPGPPVRVEERVVPHLELRDSSRPGPLRPVERASRRGGRGDRTSPSSRSTAPSRRSPVFAFTASGIGRLPRACTPESRRAWRRSANSRPPSRCPVRAQRPSPAQGTSSRVGPRGRRRPWFRRAPGDPQRPRSCGSCAAFPRRRSAGAAAPGANSASTGGGGGAAGSAASARASTSGLSSGLGLVPGLMRTSGGSYEAPTPPRPRGS